MNEMRKEIEELIKNIDDREALEIVRDAAKDLCEFCLKRKAMIEERKAVLAKQN